MRRVRQESAEFYEVAGSEVAQALGIFVMDDDDVTISTVYGDTYKIIVRHHENEDVELEAPVYDPYPVPLSSIETALALGPLPLPPLDTLSTGITADEIEQWNRDDEATF